MQIVLVREKFVCKAQPAMPDWWGSNQTLGPLKLDRLVGSPWLLCCQVELDHIEHPPEVEAENARLGREYFERVCLAGERATEGRKENTRRLHENCTSADVEQKRFNESTTSCANGKSRRAQCTQSSSTGLRWTATQPARGGVILHELRMPAPKVRECQTEKQACGL